MKASKKIDIREIFLGLQGQMSSKLSLNRKILTHSVSKGDASELEWVDMLGSYLPKRYQVEKAFVIDYEGTVSEQIDLVIFDRHYSPFLLKQNGATYVPAESVYAVLEVKPEMNPENLRYAAKKASSVRKLKRTTGQIVDARGIISDTKKPFEILAGLLTIDGSFTSSLETECKKLSMTERIHFGCSLSGGAFVVTYNEKLSFEKSGKDDSLIFFFLKLLSILQPLGTVSAINIETYIKQLKQK